MIALGEFLRATGNTTVIDKMTGGEITAANISDYGESREIMAIEAKESLFYITVGRRKHAR